MTMGPVVADRCCRIKYSPGDRDAHLDGRRRRGRCHHHAFRVSGRRRLLRRLRASLPPSRAWMVVRVAVTPELRSGIEVRQRFRPSERAGRRRGGLIKFRGEVVRACSTPARRSERVAGRRGGDDLRDGCRRVSPYRERPTDGSPVESRESVYGFHRLQSLEPLDHP